MAGTGQPSEAPTVEALATRSRSDRASDAAATTETDDAPASSVRPSAPTMKSAEVALGSVVQSPRVVSHPQSAIDRAVPELSTPTLSGASPSNAPPVDTARSGGGSSRSLVGASVGRYEVVAELGHGGMATVYRARDTRLGRDVALKVIHPHLRDNPEIAQRFKHEARAVAKLKHPSIVEIFDVPDDVVGERCLVAELVDGPSLRRWIQDHAREEVGPMPPELAGALALEVLTALACAHREGIVHRDVKPENILIAALSPHANGASRAVAKLTDFGIAKLLDAQGMTSTGQILGSPAHMAPEQIEGGEIGPQVDVFAVGVMLYELLTGALPFDGKNPAQVIRRVLEGSPTPPDRLVATVGGRWSAIVLRMLATSPRDRPATADAAARAIREELDAMKLPDVVGDLEAYFRAPREVSAAWPTKVKGTLVDRATAARDRGDVVGAAHDLNRALAYDPTDSKLVRVASAIATRNRRGRQLRRVAPIVFGAVVVATVAFVGVRAIRARPPVVALTAATETATSIAPAIATAPSIAPSQLTASTSPIGTPASVTPTSAQSVAPSIAPSVATTIAASTPPLATAAPRPSSSTSAHVVPIGRGVRRTRFSLFPPAATFSIDGEGSFDALSFGERELSVGDHKIVANGPRGCCRSFSGTVAVAAGDETLTIPVRLQLFPAHIFVKPPVGITPAQVTVTVRAHDGSLLAKGSAPLDVAMSQTSLAVSVTLEAPGISAKTIEATLSPGDARYEDL